MLGETDPWNQSTELTKIHQKKTDSDDVTLEFTEDGLLTEPDDLSGFSTKDEEEKCDIDLESQRKKAVKAKLDHFSEL